jgi:hypothetical protein
MLKTSQSRPNRFKEACRHLIPLWRIFDAFSSTKFVCWPLRQNGFFDALGAAVGRYVETTRMADTIQEYGLGTKVIAFAQEVKKGKTIRGQWFYATDEAAKRYVWFHSVQELVKRAIEDPDVTVVDLGPSGSDAFTGLKERYGFVSVYDWPAVADYLGPFWHCCDEETETDMGKRLEAMDFTTFVVVISVIAIL